MVASPLQRCENANFFSRFPFGGIQSQGLLSVIPLELQGKSINHFLGHSLSYTMEFVHRFGLRLEDGIFSPYKRTPVVQPPHQSKFLREGVRGRALFSKSVLPRFIPLHDTRFWKREGAGKVWEGLGKALFPVERRPSLSVIKKTLSSSFANR